MIYTGYYAKVSEYEQQGLICVAVSSTIPDFYRVDDTHMWLSYLSPPSELLYSWKDGSIDESEFIQRYIEERLAHVNIDKLLSLLGIGDCILLCYEKNGFCHRHIIADWLSPYLEERVKEW